MSDEKISNQIPKKNNIHESNAVTISKLLFKNFFGDGKDGAPKEKLDKGFLLSNLNSPYGTSGVTLSASQKIEVIENLFQLIIENSPAKILIQGATDHYEEGARPYAYIDRGGRKFKIKDPNTKEPLTNIQIAHIKILKAGYLDIFSQNVNDPSVRVLAEQQKGLIDFHRYNVKLMSPQGPTATRTKVNQLLRLGNMQNLTEMDLVLMGIDGFTGDISDYALKVARTAVKTKSISIEKLIDKNKTLLNKRWNVLINSINSDKDSIFIFNELKKLIFEIKKILAKTYCDAGSIDKKTVEFMQKMLQMNNINFASTIKVKIKSLYLGLKKVNNPFLKDTLSISEGKNFGFDAQFTLEKELELQLNTLEKFFDKNETKIKSDTDVAQRFVIAEYGVKIKDPLQMDSQTLLSLREKKFDPANNAALENIIDRLLLHPEEAGLILGRPLLTGKFQVNYREKIAGHQNGYELIQKLINNGDKALLNVIKKTQLLESSHLVASFTKRQMGELKNLLLKRSSNRENIDSVERHDIKELGLPSKFKKDDNLSKQAFIPQVVAEDFLNPAEGNSKLNNLMKEKGDILKKKWINLLENFKKQTPDIFLVTLNHFYKEVLKILNISVEFNVDTNFLIFQKLSEFQKLEINSKQAITYYAISCALNDISSPNDWIEWKNEQDKDSFITQMWALYHFLKNGLQFTEAKNSEFEEKGKNRLKNPQAIYWRYALTYAVRQFGATKISDMENNDRNSLRMTKL